MDPDNEFPTDAHVREHREQHRRANRAIVVYVVIAIALLAIARFVFDVDLTQRHY